MATECVYSVDLQSQLRQLRAAPTVDELDVAMTEISDEYAAAGVEVPIDIEAACNERREALEA